MSTAYAPLATICVAGDRRGRHQPAAFGSRPGRATGTPSWAARSIGAGVSAMHFVGMQALVVPGKVQWDLGLCAVAVLGGMALGAAAMVAFQRLPRPYAKWVAPTLLTLAICFMHFTAMGAVSVEYDPTVVVVPSRIDDTTMALAVAGGAMLIMLSAFGAAFINGMAQKQVQQELRRQRDDLQQRQGRAAPAESAVRYGAEQHAARAVHVRCRPEAGGLQPALRRDVPHPARADASRDVPYRYPQAALCQRRANAPRRAIPLRETARPAAGRHQGRRPQRWPHHPGDPARHGIGLGRIDPRGHHRARAARSAAQEAEQAAAAARARAQIAQRRPRRRAHDHEAWHRHVRCRRASRRHQSALRRGLRVQIATDQARHDAARDHRGRRCRGTLRQDKRSRRFCRRPGRWWPARRARR